MTPQPNDAFVVEWLDERAWCEALDSLPGYSFFATPRYIRAWVEFVAGRGKARALRVKDRFGGWRLVAMAETPIRGRLPLRTILASPEVGYGVAGTDAIEPGWIGAALRHMEGVRLVGAEITIDPDLHEAVPNSGGCTVDVQQAWLIDISGGYEHWRDCVLEKRARRQLRVCENEGVATTRHGVDGLDAFYALYVRAARSDSSPERRCYPKEFFRRLLTGGGPGEPLLYLTRYQDQLIAAGLLLRGGDRAVAWIGAMDRDHARMNGNLSRHDAVIRGLGGSGVRSYNLGAATGLPSVAAFKSKLGALPRDYVTVTWTNSLWSRRRSSSMRP